MPMGYFLRNASIRYHAGDAMSLPSGIARNGNADAGEHTAREQMTPLFRVVANFTAGALGKTGKMLLA